jgi:hypothetical protein
VRGEAPRGKFLGFYVHFSAELLILDIFLSAI